MTRAICPFCLKPHDFSISQACTAYPQEIVPDEYISRYNLAPPVSLLPIGFSRHGKTTYLAALTLMLENMDKVWRGMFNDAFDQETVNAIQQMRREATQGDVPKKTENVVSRPLLLGLKGLPDIGSRCLVMYDVRGQIFDSINEVQQYLAAIKQVTTTWFLVSLKDLERDQAGRAITDLFLVYRKGMNKLKAQLKNRNLIVVYTKADQIAFPSEIEAYLASDPYHSLTLPGSRFQPSDHFSLQSYRLRMQEISDILEDFTREKVDKGNAFINMVKDEGMNLYFSTVSALGGELDSGTNRMREKAQRYRVLDPFLWALTLQMEHTTRTISLIIDGSSKSTSIYEMLPGLWDQLSEHGDVTTYYLGIDRPKSQPGQKPPMQPPYPHRKRLIGPILEQIPSDTRVLVLAAGPIADLPDFAQTSWRDRVVVVLTEDDQQIGWPHVFIHRKDDDLTPLVNALLSL